MSKQAGRPTNYKPEFCEMLIEHQKNGFSFESFGAIAGVGRRVLYEWVNIYPDFKAAREMSREHCAIYWETMIRACAAGTKKNMNPFAIRFAMMNMVGWKAEGSEIEDKTKDQEQNKISVSYDVKRPEVKQESIEAEFTNVIETTKTD